MAGAPGLRMGVLVVAMLACVACSGDGTRTDTQPASEPSPTTESTPTPTASPSPAGTSEQQPPEVGSMDEPPATSGDLALASFPTPQQLGPDWSYSVDAGSAEEGYSGNGTPALARRPDEIAQTALPFGCPTRPRLPLAEHALEVGYRDAGHAVVTVRLSFADEASARAFFDGRADGLRTCVGVVPSPAIGPLVTGLVAPRDGVLVSARTPASDPWQELAMLSDRQVVLIARQGDDSFTDAEGRRLGRLFHFPEEEPR